MDSESLVSSESHSVCPTLCNPMDSSPKGSSVHGILQARILVLIAVPFSKGFFLTQELKN